MNTIGRIPNCPNFIPSTGKSIVLPRLFHRTSFLRKETVVTGLKEDLYLQRPWLTE